MGLSVAKSLAYSLGCPIIGINHVEAHPYANVLDHGEMQFPILHLVVAGGHTLLMHSRDHFDYDIIGSTIDDAAGECVDKVAKLFGFPMPGGPVVDQAAMKYSGNKYDFPRPLLNKKTNNFSFSGLKTAMLRFRGNCMQPSSTSQVKQDKLSEIIIVLIKFFMCLFQLKK